MGERKSSHLSRKLFGRPAVPLGVVNLGGKDRFGSRGWLCGVASDRRRRLPDGERSRTQKSMIRGFQQVPS